MKKALIGQKLGMTQIFDENGTVIPVTVLEAGPCVVAQVKTLENDGYEAIQLGFGEVKENKLNKPEKGHFAKANVTAKKHLREFRLDSIEGIKVGDELKADVFVAGDKIDVQGTSKGKGFQGVIKRWNIRIQYGKAARSSKERHVGSIGPWTPNRTMWTVAQAGQMGYHKRTEFNKKILKIGENTTVSEVNPDGGFINYGLVKNDYVLVKGSLPGPSKRLVILRKAIRPKSTDESAPQINFISTESKQGV